QESRPARAAREEQDGVAFGRERAAVGAPQTEQAPVVERAATLAMVEARRYHDLEALGQARFPAVLLQIVRDRGEHIGHVGPDVPPPVAGEIDRVLDEARWHELRLPHGACE